MTSAQFTRLRAILTDQQLLQLASEFPAFRIPLKKLEMLKARDEFFQRHDGTNTRQLARALGVPLSTAYNWLSRRSNSTGKRTRMAFGTESFHAVRTAVEHTKG